jgi:hypothetical protein
MSQSGYAARSLVKYAEQTASLHGGALVYFDGQKIALKKAMVDEGEWPGVLIGTTIHDLIIMIDMMSISAVAEIDRP